MESITGMSFGLLIAIVAFFFLFSYLIPIRLWLAAMFSGAYVGLLTLIGMRFRRIPPKFIVEPRIAAISACVGVSCWMTMRLLTYSFMTLPP